MTQALLIHTSTQTITRGMVERGTRTPGVPVIAPKPIPQESLSSDRKSCNPTTTATSTASIAGRGCVSVCSGVFNSDNRNTNKDTNDSRPLVCCDPHQGHLEDPNASAVGVRYFEKVWALEHSSGFGLWTWHGQSCTKSRFGCKIYRCTADWDPCPCLSGWSAFFEGWFS